MKISFVNKEHGSALVETMAVAPIAALIVVIALQLSQLFTQAVANVASADAAAARAVRAWDSSNSLHGFERPCLEDMPKTSFSTSGDPIAIGVGPFKKYVTVSQEVRVVGQPICIR